MKNISIAAQLPYVFAFKDGQMQAVPTFVGSTLLTCFLITFVPSLMPLWMLCASNQTNVKG
jgi:hypothetical protein